MNTLKKDWKPNLGLKHILLVCASSLKIFLQVQREFENVDDFFRQTIKCLLIVPNAESALNEEAGKLLLENYEEYYKRASMMTEIHAQVISLYLLREYFSIQKCNF